MEKKKIIMIAGGVIILAGIGYLVYRNRKKKSISSGSVSAEESEMLKSMGLDENGNDLTSQTGVSSVSPPTFISGGMKPFGRVNQPVADSYPVAHATSGSLTTLATLKLSKDLPASVTAGQPINFNFKTGSPKMGSIRSVTAPNVISVFPSLNSNDARNLTSISLTK